MTYRSTPTGLDGGDFDIEWTDYPLLREHGADSISALHQMPWKNTWA